MEIIHDDGNGEQTALGSSGINSLWYHQQISEQQLTFTSLNHLN